jgi:hypothetical protein
MVNLLESADASDVAGRQAAKLVRAGVHLITYLPMMRTERGAGLPNWNQICFIRN